MSVSKTLTANGSKGHHKFTLTVTETATSVTDNTSTVTIVFKLSPISTGWDWEDHSSVKGSVTVNGTTYNWTRPTYNGSSTVTLVSKTQVITHSSDGTKTINLSFSCQSDTSYSYLPGTASASGSLALTAIARESTLTVSGTKTLGNQVTLNVTRASGSYTHTITTKCGSSSSISIVTKSNNLAPTFTLPIDWASQNTTGTSVSVTFTITTYKSDTKIGSSKTTTITASIPTSVKPTVSNVVIEPGDTASESHLAKYNGYVKGKSKLKITVTGQKSYSSNLTTFNITCDGKSYAGSPTSTSGTTSTPIITSVLTTVGTTNVANSTVTDARGRTSANVSSNAFTVLDYNTPAITLALHRSDENGNEEMTGSYCRAEWNDTISSLNGFNSGTITLWKKISSSNTYEEITLTSEDLSNKRKIFSADDDKTYDIKIIITDDFMSVSAISSLSTGVVPIHFHKSGNGMGLGHMAVGSDRLDIGWNTYIKDINILDALFYKPGDSITFGNGIQFAGLVTASTKQARFTIHLGKSLQNINTITVTQCEGGVRTPTGGYMNSVGDDGNWFNQANVSISVTKKSDYDVVLGFTSTVAFTNVSNNQCLIYNASPLSLEFS